MSGEGIIRSIPGVCEVVELGGPPRLLIEVPHGATTLEHYEAVRRRLHSPLPDRLEEFYFVNTDVGAPECASRIAEEFVKGAGASGAGVLAVRCLVPRTFIDCNRAAEVATEDFRRSQLTPALPEYIVNASDGEILNGLYDDYQQVAAAAYETVCGSGGMALTLHTYAPKSVGIHTVDARIVERLHEAYEEPLYGTWPDRPPVDLITQCDDGSEPASAELISRIRSEYGKLGIEVGESVTYRLHPATMAYRHSRRYPGKVLCLEISRDLLADPFTPFRPVRIGQAKVERMTRPIVEAYLSQITR